MFGTFKYVNIVHKLVILPESKSITRFSMAVRHSSSELRL